MAARDLDSSVATFARVRPTMLSSTLLTQFCNWEHQHAARDSRAHCFRLIKRVECEALHCKGGGGKTQQETWHSRTDRSRWRRHMKHSLEHAVVCSILVYTQGPSTICGCKARHTDAHRTPHTAHRTPHTAHRTPHTEKVANQRNTSRSQSC